MNNNWYKKLKLNHLGHSLILFYCIFGVLFGVFFFLLDELVEKLLVLPLLLTAFFVATIVNLRLRKEIEDHKRTARALEYREELFSGIFNNAAVGIALFDKEGYYHHVNATFCRMIGYTKDELKNMKCHDITYEADLEKSMRLSNEIWEGAYSWRTGEKRFVCKNGEILWTEINLSAIRNAYGIITDMIVVIIDITVRKTMEQELLDQATTDCLTGVDNRLAFVEKGQDEFSRALRYGRDFGLLLLDVDYFKQVNDQHGHLVGDRVLKCIASACKGALRETDMISRIGGEEFAVILIESDLKTSISVAERIQQRVKDLEITIGDITVRVTVSIGIAVILPSDQTLDDIFKRADDALYTAKNSGRNTIVIDAGNRSNG